jgi:hypothetical protein
LQPLDPASLSRERRMALAKVAGEAQ